MYMPCSDIFMKLNQLKCTSTYFPSNFPKMVFAKAFVSKYLDILNNLGRKKKKCLVALEEQKDIKRLKFSQLSPPPALKMTSDTPGNVSG
ncbi:CLUMA_CG002922, isoform A [Clunio marinus]|uniref:CLUMA_CG002922, isoform A n=1 Tax=Clunio marinus TaxID=568069 RepID=A0A1J1HSI8_9DIPT|nr:CLUMA_CG002922, isoform A [Clunio marinus]